MDGLGYCAGCVFVDAHGRVVGRLCWVICGVRVWHEKWFGLCFRVTLGVVGAGLGQKESNVTGIFWHVWAGQVPRIQPWEMGKI